MTPGLVAFFVVMAILAGAYALFAPSHTVTTAPRRPGGVPEETKVSGFDRWVRPAITNLMPSTPKALGEYARRNDKVAALLARTGNPWRVSPEEYIVVRVASLVVGVLALMVLTILWSAMGIDLVPLPIAAAVGALLGYLAPKSILDAAWGKRRRDLTTMLPEALDLMRICMNAGYSFQNALQETITMMPVSITRDELTRVNAELRAGRTESQALSAFARRCPTDGVEAFVRVMDQRRATGADVASTLSAQAEETRLEYERMIEQRAQKLQTTLFLPLIGFFLPTLLILIFGPSVSSLMNAL